VSFGNTLTRHARALTRASILFGKCLAKVMDCRA
jgi:hypothetical protein